MSLYCESNVGGVRNASPLSWLAPITGSPNKGVSSSGFQPSLKLPSATSDTLKPLYRICPLVIGEKYGTNNLS